MDGSRGGTVRVLHVDDDADLAEMVATFLETEDERFTVETATSAAAGVERLADGEFDCVVSDYDMPGTDGIAFLERVRRTQPKLPFILYTGHGSEAVASDAISAGVTEYLQKTTATEQYTLLANRISQVVSRRRAELDYWEIFEKSVHGILIHDPDTGAVLDANQEFCAMTGYSSGEVVGMRVPDFSVDDPGYSGARSLELIRAAIDGDPQTFEWSIRTSTGDPLPVEVSLKQTTLSGRDRVLAIVRDLRDRKDRERQIETLDALIGTVVGQLPMGVLIEDADRTVRMANDAFTDLFALDEPGDGLVGRDAASVTEAMQSSFGDPEAFVERTEDRLARGEPARDETFDLVDSRTVERDYVPYALPEGEGNLWLYRDVTARQRREQQLAALFDNASVPIVYTEFEGDDPIVLRANPPFESVFGHEDDRVRGESLDELVVPADKRADAADINRRVLDGERLSVEVRRLTPDGVRDFILHSVPLRREEANGAYAIYHDVTDRNEYRRQLERQNDRLDRFASIASHDLRNPLAVATGHLELARAECDSAHLESADEALDRCRALIADLLALARDGKRVPETDPVELDRLVADAWASVERPGARLLTEPNLTLRADPRYLTQLLENLLRNAVENGGSDVTVRVGATGAGFYVADDGPGIPAEDRDRVFDTDYSASEGGTGFGLFIVKDIAEAHGWSVRVTDSASGGARIEVSDVDVLDAGPDP